MPAPRTETQHNAAQDANQFPTLTGVSGTAGTADTSGTAEIVRVGVNPTTGALYTEDLSSDPGTVVTVDHGTVSTTSPTGFEGGTVSVGTAAVELTFTGVTKGVFIQADSANGTMVYVGPASVTQAGSNAVARLDAGESLSLDLNDASAPLYAVGGTTAQKVYKLAVI